MVRERQEILVSELHYAEVTADHLHLPLWQFHSVHSSLGSLQNSKVPVSREVTVSACRKVMSHLLKPSPVHLREPVADHCVISVLSRACIGEECEVLD